MAIYLPSPYISSSRQNLSESIASSARRGTLRITDELMGYVFSANAIAQQYSPPERPKYEIDRKVLAPELLRGLVANKLV